MRSVRASARASSGASNASKRPSKPQRGAEREASARPVQAGRSFAQVDAEYFSAVDLASPRPWRFADDKRLILLRHGKSDWSVEGVLDRQRQLKARGRARAESAGVALRTRGWIPELIVTSDATRALETVKAACKGMALDRPRVLEIRELYEVTHGDDVSGAASLQAIGAAVLNSVIPTDETVMCVGHNYGFELAARDMAKLSQLEAEDLTLKTAHAALFTRRGGGSTRVGERFYAVRAVPLRERASAFRPVFTSSHNYAAVIFCASGVVIRAMVGEKPRAAETQEADPWANGFENKGGFTFEGVLDPDREFENKLAILEGIVERKLHECAHVADLFGKNTLKLITNSQSIRDMEREVMTLIEDRDDD